MATARPAAAWLPLCTCCQQSIDISCPLGPQQQTYSNEVQQPDGTGGQSDGRTLDSYIDPALHAMEAVPLRL